jgi:uncharacterized membrane protein YphA (DoxX/SURF4 family)
MFAGPFNHEANRRRLDDGNQIVVQRLDFARLVLPIQMMTMSGFTAKYFSWFVPPTTVLQSFVLLIVRLYWGWEFFLTGKGKLMDLEKPTQFFQSLGIPFPHAQAMLAGATESFGGLLLLAGLCSRLVSIPLMILLSVAYLTADLDVTNLLALRLQYNEIHGRFAGTRE